MTTLLRLWRYLCGGPSALYLPAAWLEDRHRLAEYEMWTERQRYQGSVVKDTAATRRDRFWEYVAERDRVRAGRVAGTVRKFERRG